MNIDESCGAKTVDQLAARADTIVGGGAVAVAVADLDGFGQIYESIGRDAAARTVTAWVAMVTASLPEGAVVGHLGGDEVGIALPEASAESALIVLEEIRSHLAAHPIENVALSATFGVAARPPHATNMLDLFRCAGEALARGKREGGGRVAIHVEEKMVMKSNYYRRGSLDRLSKLAGGMQRTEASLLREALHDLFDKYRGAATP